MLPWAFKLPGLKRGGETRPVARHGTFGGLDAQSRVELGQGLTTILLVV